MDETVVNKTFTPADPHLKKFLGEKTFKVGLDLGCGDGRSAITFGDNVEHYHCIDVNERSLKDFKNRPGFDLNKFFLRCFNGEIIPFNDNFFDFISSITVYEHIKDSKPLLRESFRVLKPGGILLIQNDAWFYHVLSKIGLIDNKDLTHINMRAPNFLERQLKEVGYSIIKKAYFPFWRFGRTFHSLVPSFLATKGTFLCVKPQKNKNAAY